MIIDPSSSSFHLNLHLISPSHPFNHDYEHLVFSTCLLEKVERCKKIKTQVPELTYAFCVINSFSRCMRVEFLDDPLLKKAIAAESLCYKKFKEHKSILILGDCLFQWYERYVEEYCSCRLCTKSKS